MENTKKVLVGFFVGTALLLFGVGLFLIGDSNQLFTKSFDVYAEFKKITGVQTGGRVRVSGMDAGTVTRIEIPSRPDAKFRVHFRIVEKLHGIVRQDSVVSIQTDGLLGNKFLQVEAGTASASVAQNHSMIPSKEPFDWGDLMDEINGVVKQASGIMAGVQDQLVSTLDEVKDTVKTANVLITGSTPAVQHILASADKIGGDLRQIIEGVQAGEGTIGALIKDKEIYASVKRSVDKSEHAVESIRQTTASAQKLTQKFEESDIVPEVQRTVKHVQELTVQIKEAVQKFQSASGEGGVGENLQQTLANANEAMSNLSDNTEALKHNFFFRGFFNRRGFFDLGALSAPEYRNANFGKGFAKERTWLNNEDLFVKDASGAEVLSTAGKAKLDAAMTALLELPRNGPFIIEGHAAAGSAAEQYLAGRRRAVRVETYLLGRFHLRPAYTGIVSLGGGTLEGVALVSFYKK